MSRSVTRTAIWLLALAVVGVWTSTPASAHGPVGEMTVLVAEPVGTSQVRIQVGIVYENDKELAEEAVVVAQLTGPDGATVGPVDLPRTTGAMYEAVVDVPSPGAWTAVISSTEPTAEQTATIEVSETPASTSTTTATSTSAGTSTTASSAPPTTAATGSGGDDSSSSALPLVIVIVVVVVAAIAGFVVLQRRSRTS